MQQQKTMPNLTVPKPSIGSLDALSPSNQAWNESETLIKAVTGLNCPTPPLLIHTSNSLPRLPTALGEMPAFFLTTHLVFDRRAGLPEVECVRFGMHILFSRLSIPTVVTVLTAMLLERRIVVECDQPYTLSAIVMSLPWLLRPYKWQTHYIPYLPFPLLDFLSAPVPYIAGVLQPPAYGYEEGVLVLKPRTGLYHVHPFLVYFQCFSIHFWSIFNASAPFKHLIPAQIVHNSIS